MNSTHSFVSRLTQTVLLSAFVLLGTQVSFADESPMERPAALERDVQFWIRVYTQASTNGGYMHDENNLGVVYSEVKFAPNTAPKERTRIIEGERDKYTAALRRIASGASPLSEDDQRIKDMWGDEGTTSRLLDATDHIRFQLGQSDRFREGLLRSGAWQAHIAETLANMGLPPELAVLPHVESSFNPAAYSKVGAAGLWQFMRSTGRRYMRIDNVVDDRMDPFRSTEAAAQLLSYNYRLLGSWPLALTAYNHGAAGMRRAKDSMGTDDIVRIVRGYKSPSFGFASRNFYVSFLAALEIDKNPEKYYGAAVERQPEAKFQEIELPAYVPIASLERVLKIPRDRLRTLNPALLPTVWRGQNHVPRGYRLRLPATDDIWTAQLLAQRLAPNELLGGQPVPARHRVRKGDTLASVAKQYGVSTRELASMNGLSTKAKLRAGRYVRIPESTAPVLPTLVATTTAPPPAKAGSTLAAGSEEPAPKIYVVRRGESITEIAKKTNVPEAQLLKINRIKNPNFVFEGQRLLLAASDLPADAAAEAAVPVAPSPPVPAVVASAQPAPGGVPTAVAERESEEDAAAVEKVAKPATKEEPVSAAQADAIGPAIGPAAESAESADPIDYTVAKDNTIRVAAAETLGHYADWLGASAASLRKLNNMKYGKPVLIGRKIKLPLEKSGSREAFEAKRRDYHRTLQAQYFASHRILGTEVYIARRGDSLWNVTQRFARLPVWLLQQYNPDTDFSEMRAGTQIVVPRVEEVVAAGGGGTNDT
jgi:membrane-bound lytic murein transglycosylase D